jgi:hypothetical protein
MRLTRICALTLALSVCGTAAAQVVTVRQVGTLVKHDTANDPCEKFKMRVLMPSDVSPKPRLEAPVGPPDPGIVWDPCRGDVIQIAAGSMLLIVTPEQGTPPAVPPFTLPSPPPRSEQPTVLGVKLPPAFEMMRRHE